MAYRRWLVLASLSFCAACSRDTGILVSVTRGTALTASIDQLQFVIGAETATPGMFVKRADDPDVPVPVAGRDLLKNPYKLLLHDSPAAGSPTVALMVAVIASSNGTPVAFAAFDQPQAFAKEQVLERDLVLTAATLGQEFSQPYGCLVWSADRIVPESDVDCDGDPPTDCDDTDGGPLPDGCLGGECDQDSQCSTLKGAPSCAGGGWKCIAGVCTAQCACSSNAPPVPCYEGPMGTEGVGVCHGGVRYCANGQLGPCTGQVVPSPEACNLQDDDCNGAVDDGLGTFSCGIGGCAVVVPACHQGVIQTCVPGVAQLRDLCDGKDENCDGVIDGGCNCVHVATTGNDTMAVTDNNVTPFVTIQAAVNWGDSLPTKRTSVCVADTAVCNTTRATYDKTVLTMANGISVYGGYESTGWTRCGGATALVMDVPEGVVFPSTVTTPTVLDGFSITRATAGGLAQVVGVTVMGAKGATISNVMVLDAPAAPTTIGVDVSGGGSATILHSTIAGGAGSVLSVAVRAVGSHVDLLDNCPQLDSTGACNIGCSMGSTGGVLIGRNGPAVVGGGTGESYAVLLDGAVGSTVVQSLLCGVGGATGAGLRVRNDGKGVIVRQNSIYQSGAGVDSHAVWLEDCKDASPWIVANANITSAGASASSRADGVHAIGACHPVIDSNRLIVGGSEGNAGACNGVHCGQSAAGVASRCTVLGADLQVINGAGGGVPPTSTGVRCDAGSCLRVERNIISGHAGVDVVGLSLSSTGTFVDRNVITGGCTTNSAVGILAQNAYARIQSNRVSGGGCTNGTATSSLNFYGMRVALTAGGNQLDVDSNDLDGGGQMLGCTSHGVKLESGMPLPAAPAGVFRSNIVVSGMCPMRYDFREADANADPSVLDSNDFDPQLAPTALYIDEGATTLSSAAAINGLTDAQSSGNLSQDAMFTSYPSNLHLLTGSVCIGAGSTVNPPVNDLDGVLRKSPPSIGCYEGN
jgi:hypothetical protein